MHAVLSDVARDEVTATATVATWNGAASTISWLTCGEHAPILITADGELDVLDDVLPALGSPDMPAHPEPHCRRIAVGERLLLLSDGVRDRGRGPRSDDRPARRRRHGRRPRSEPHRTALTAASNSEVAGSVRRCAFAPEPDSTLDRSKTAAVVGAEALRSAVAPAD